MKYTPLGRSGLLVSSLAFGCMSFNRFWGVDRALSTDLVKAALDAGITLFDNANVYGGGGGAETILGEALAALGIRRDEVVIATKVCNTMSPLPNGRGLGRKHILAQIDASLKRLGTDHVDLLQIHRFDPNTPIEETLDALDDVVRAGKVRYLGASSMFAWQLMKMLAYSTSRGQARFISMQNYYNLLYREEEREMIPLCRDQGLSCLVWSPLARGRLARTGETKRGGMSGDDVVHPQDAAIIAAVHAIAAERGVQPATVALAWLLSKPGVAAPVIGLSRPDQLAGALAAVELELTGDEIGRLEAPYRAVDVQGIHLPAFLDVPWRQR